MKKKYIAVVLSALMAVAVSGCENGEDNSESIVNTLPNTTDIFNIENRGDMAVTLYYDVEEPNVSFIAPDGTVISTIELPTDRGDGAVCFHIANAVPGQWYMNYDKKTNNSLEVNWAPE